jgi:putative chitinase
MSMYAGALARLDALELHVIAEIKAIRGMLEVTSAPVAPPAAANDDSAAFAFEDYGLFYEFLRGNKMLGPKIINSEFKGCDAIIKACANAGWPISWTAYALATAYHETAHTMQPIPEKGGNAYFKRMYDIQGNRPAKARELGNLTPGDGVKYHGRGYVQLTGRRNYQIAGQRLGVDLVNHPEKALEAEIAARIMIHGMVEGWFTSRKLPDDLPPKGPALLRQFVLSRDIINGTDKDDEIAAYANDFQTGLQLGGYKIAA